MEQNDELPAILGGVATFPNGPPSWPPVRDDVRDALLAAYHDRSWGRYHGGNVATLIDDLKAFHQCEFVELCCSGTAAVELALRGLRIGAGDEVILAAYEFKGNFADVLSVGAVPVLVDVSAGRCTIDLQKIESAITTRTKALLISHLHGDMVDMPEAMRLSESHGLKVIEDACQTPGATVAGRRAGCWGDVGTLSFGGSKLLSAGRGGAIVTNNAAIAQRIRLYCERGNHAYPLSELQAAVLVPQLRTLDEDNRRRENAVARLFRLFGEQGWIPPSSPAGSSPAYYKTAFWHSPEILGGLSRRDFVEAMRQEGVAVDAGFRALHLSHAQSRFRGTGELRFAAQADENLVVLHHPVLLEPESVLDRLLEAFRKIRRHASAVRKHVETDRQS